MESKSIVILIAIAVVGLVIFFEEIPVKPFGEPKLAIESLDVGYHGSSSTIHEVRIGVGGITLKNIGECSFDSKIIFEVVINNQNKSVCGYANIEIEPNETWSRTWSPDGLYLEVKRQPVEYKLEGILYIKDKSGEIMDNRNFSVLIPTAKVGDTILLNTRRSAGDDTSKRFDMSLNSWHIEPIPENAPHYVTGGEPPEKLKDVILNVTIRNNYHKIKVETPGIFASVMSDKGYVEYGRTSPPSYEDLYPEEEITGEIRVAIPKSWNPVEMSICYTDEIIVLS